MIASSINWLIKLLIKNLSVVVLEVVVVVGIVELVVIEVVVEVVVEVVGEVVVDVVTYSEGLKHLGKVFSLKEAGPNCVLLMSSKEMLGKYSPAQQNKGKSRIEPVETIANWYQTL